MPKPRKARSIPKKASRKAAHGAAKPLRQVAALPVRRDAEGSVEVLLVTSRESRRWITPKG